MQKENYITSEKKLCSYIGIVGKLYSDTTKHSRLDWFKQNLYFCSSGLSNPMFLDMAQDALAISEELMNINELMYKFMCDEKHKYLTFNILENISSKYESSSFTWKIPNFVVPFLTAYILASDSSKKDTSASHFFQRLDNYFKEASKNLTEELIYDRENVSKLYQEWTTVSLGREYFDTLDSLYETFTNTSTQKTALRNSVYGLTRILVECPVAPIPAYVNTIINHYKKLLIKKAHTSTPTSQDLVPFYKHDEAWKINNELNFVEYLVDKLSKIVLDLYSYINDYLIEDGKPSKYKISVNHYDIFQEKYWKYLHTINFQLEHLEKEFYTFFKTVENAPSISQAVNSRRIIINKTNKEKHIDTLSKLITKYYSQIQKAFIDFLKSVRKASENNPEKYSTLIMGKDYLSELKNDIMISQDRLSKKIENTLNELPDILCFHNPGYIQNLAYPIGLFYEDDILRITYELTQNYCVLSKERIIQHFENQGLNFPISRPDVITFLLTFNQLIKGL